jgi:hypothetical protein
VGRRAPGARCAAPARRPARRPPPAVPPRLTPSRAPAAGFSGWTLKDFARYIKKELCTGPELQREPTHADVVALSIKAGFLPASPASSTASGASTATVSGGAGAGAGGGRVAHKKAGPAEFRAFQLYLEA